MGYRLEPYTTEWEPAAGRYNERLHASGAAPFLLPGQSPAAAAAAGPITRGYFLVADDSNEVRGSCLMQHHRAWVDQTEAEAVNIQSPLSEGLADRRHAGVAPWMMREIVRRHPFAYSVGMGSETLPYPRLLRSLGWRVAAAPFYFRVLDGRRFLAQMRPLREHPRFGSFASIGAAIPLLPGLAFTLLHAWRRKRGSSGAPPAAAQAADWSRIRTRYGFAVERDPASLDWLYPPADGHFRRTAVSGGLAVLRTSQFSGHPYFGDLRVATLAEILAEPGAERSLIRAATGAARQMDAAVVVTNQSAPELCAAVEAEGWISYRSNYLTALSPPLAAKAGTQACYITRGDGDGLVNL